MTGSIRNPTEPTLSSAPKNPFRKRRGRTGVSLLQAPTEPTPEALGVYPDRLKRGMDLVLGGLLLALLWPVMVLIALLVKMEDGGTVFFVQTRVGVYGREFPMTKFRSMRCDAEQELPRILPRNRHPEPVTFKAVNDPRVTRVGRWLRRFSLDELPQLLDVLRGDMSLVGPRPSLPSEVARYAPSDCLRLHVPQGMTGLWQVSGRSEIPFSGQVALDLHYARTRSLRGDLWILLKTIPAVISGRGAC
jgi:lipopolysaccharide/colanic/teichoic acid biosynthesis glycosyltransferase